MVPSEGCFRRGRASMERPRALGLWKEGDGACASGPLGRRRHRACTPDATCETQNRIGERQNLWDKAQEARKEAEIHPLLREAGVHAGLGTLAQRTGQRWRGQGPFRQQPGGGGWGGAAGGGWWG